MDKSGGSLAFSGGMNVSENTSTCRGKFSIPSGMDIPQMNMANSSGNLQIYGGLDFINSSGSLKVDSGIDIK